MIQTISYRQLRPVDSQNLLHTSIYHHIYTKPARGLPRLRLELVLREHALEHRVVPLPEEHGLVLLPVREQRLHDVVEQRRDPPRGTHPQSSQKCLNFTEPFGYSIVWKKQCSFTDVSGFDVF